MPIILSFMFMIFLSLNLCSKEMVFSFNNFKEASTAKDFLKFKGSSTKFKLITTEFEGYAKKFTFNFLIENNLLKMAKFIIDADAIDSDSSSRDEKMRNLCLKTQDFKTIEASLLENIIIEEVTEKVTNISLSIKGKTLLRPLTYSITKVDNAYKVDFKTDFSFVDAAIDDPSILIAKVHELFQIEGSILLKEELTKKQ